MGAQAPALKRTISINRASVLTLGRAVAASPPTRNTADLERCESRCVNPWR